MPWRASRWLVVLGCLVAVLTGPVLVASTFSVFFATLLQSERWSRTGIAFAYSAYVVMYGLSGPIVGRSCEKYGPKRVILAGAVLIAAGFILVSLTRDVWQFSILYGLMGITAGMTGIVPVTTLVFRWFAGDRGLAMGAASSGTLGGLFLSSLGYFLIEHLGWRMACSVLGIGAGILLFGTILATVDDAPDGRARSEKGGREAEKIAETAIQPAAYDLTSGDLTLREAMRGAPFWLLTVSGFLFLGALAGLLAHAVPLAMDRGLAKGLAALSLGLIIGVGPAGKVGLGYMADHFQARKVLVASFFLQGVAIIVMLLGEGVAPFWTFVILFAVGQGGALAVAPIVLADLFGSTYLGSLVGTYWLIATAGSLIGPPLAAAIREDAGTYSPVLIVFAASLFCAAFLTGLIREKRSSSFIETVESLPGRTAPSSV
jgi:MFS family permease